MKAKLGSLVVLTLLSTAPSHASECGQQIQAIERRMQSAGASEVTGKPPNPDAKAQASNAAGQAPAPNNPAQKPTPEKMKDAQALIDKAKQQDKAGDKGGCEKSMADAQARIGALP